MTMIVLELNGLQVPRGTYPAVQRNAAVTKDTSRKVPRPVVIMGDFMSSLGLQLAVQGSRSKINF